MNPDHIRLHTQAIAKRPRHAWFHLKGIAREFRNELLLWRDLVIVAWIAATTEEEA